MVDLARLGRLLANDIEQSVTDEEKGMDLIHGIGREFTEHFNEISKLILVGEHNFGKENFQAQMGHVGPVINKKIKHFSHTISFLMDKWHKSKIAELKKASSALEELNKDLKYFKNKLLSLMQFNTAQEALDYFQDEVVSPFRNEFFSCLRKEEKKLDYSRKWELSTAQ